MEDRGTDKILRLCARAEKGWLDRIEPEARRTDADAASVVGRKRPAKKNVSVDPVGLLESSPFNWLIFHHVMEN